MRTSQWVTTITKSSFDPRFAGSPLKLPFALVGYSENRGLRPGWIHLLRIDVQFFKRLLGLLWIEFAVTRQSSKRRRNNGFGVYLKVTPQVFTVVAASEAIRAQTLEPVSQPRRELVRNDLHVVGGCDDRTRRALQSVTMSGFFSGSDGCSRFQRSHRERVAAQLVVAGHAPHVGGDPDAPRESPARAALRSGWSRCRTTARAATFAAAREFVDARAGCLHGSRGHLAAAA